MVRKLREMTASDQHAMVDMVLGSAQQIWQAGLGAFAKAQQEGSALFDKLVQEGAELHQLTRHLSEDKSLGVADKVSRLAENVGKQAAVSWDKIEKIFEERVARSLRSLGVPSQEELGALRRELAELREMMDAASLQARAPRTAAARPAPAAKPPAKAKPKRAQIKGAAPVAVAPKRQAKAAPRPH